MSDTLQTRQVIPPITARTSQGAIVRAWDYKHKRNLVIAFLHSDCDRCTDWLARLTEHGATLAEHQATVLLIWSKLPPTLAIDLPSHLVAAADTDGKSHRAFLGDDAFGVRGLDRVGAFVTDRYGELYSQWIGWDASELPAPKEVMSVLWQIQNTC